MLKVIISFNIGTVSVKTIASPVSPHLRGATMSGGKLYSISSIFVLPFQVLERNSRNKGAVGPRAFRKGGEQWWR